MKTISNIWFKMPLPSLGPTPHFSSEKWVKEEKMEAV